MPYSTTISDTHQFSDELKKALKDLCITNALKSTLVCIISKKLTIKFSSHKS